MRHFVVQRILQSFVIIVFTVFFVFLVLNIAPGDYVTSIAGMDTTPATMSNLRTQLHLNIPMEMRAMTWFANWIQGDWGYIQSLGGIPVLQTLIRSSGWTLSMVFISLSMGLLLATLLASIAVHSKNKAVPNWITFFTISGNALPEFWVAIVAALALSILSGGTFITPGYRGLIGMLINGVKMSPIEWAPLVAIPMIIMTLRFCAMFTKLLRASLMEHINDDYIRTAHAKGLSAWRVHWQHLFPNSALPILTMIGMVIPEVFTTCVVLETVIGLPGLGALMLHGAFSRDGQLLGCLVSYVALLSVLISTMIDMLYMVVDPRIRYV